MKKENWVLVGLLGVIVVIACVCAFFAFQNRETEEKDAVKIKEEYGSLNGQINENNKKEYPIVELDDNNPFVYKTEEEIVKILESGSAIIYFGFPTCPWCRTILPILEEAAKEESIGEIYYLNIKDIRSTLALDENNKVMTQKEGSADYYKILDLLKDYLSDYTLYDSKGKSIETNEKRLYAPTIVAVQGGKIKAIHEGTVDAQETGYETLSESDREKLKNTLKELLNSISLDVCTDAC